MILEEHSLWILNRSNKTKEKVKMEDRLERRVSKAWLLALEVHQGGFSIGSWEVVIRLCQSRLRFYGHMRKRQAVGTQGTTWLP